MVSKVAVIALVAIVACPILLGYGMNLEKVTHTVYKDSNDIVDVSPLLRNGEGYYTPAIADVYTINSKFKLPYDDKPILPLYQNSVLAHTTTSLDMGYFNWDGEMFDLGDFNEVLLVFDYTLGGPYLNIGLYSGSDLLYYQYAASGVYYDRSANYLEISFYNNSTEMYDTIYFSGSNYTGIKADFVGMSSVSVGFTADPILGRSYYVDLSSGFRLYPQWTSPLIVLPKYTSSFLMTINLNSATDPTYNLDIDHGYGTLHLHKRTTNGVVTWSYDGPNGEEPIYYDNSRSDNTYQIYSKFTGKYEYNGRYICKSNTELRYVGGWPTLFGEATPYFTYNSESSKSLMSWEEDTGFNTIRVFDMYSKQSVPPIVRMDSAVFAAFKNIIIQDEVYDPASFRNNPSTKMTDIGRFGSYIGFGGNTYFVKDGNITLGTREASVKNMVFDSIPVTGGYSNRINGTAVSTTATPSTITFGGQWDATILTNSKAETTYTSTEWIPGEFAWDGIDQNFLMIGLLAALGVFIALGIAYRKTKAALGALLIVCGGAMLLFFAML